MEALLPIIIQAVTGAIGGLGVSAAMKQSRHERGDQVVSGVIGGVAGGQILTNVLTDPPCRARFPACWATASAALPAAAF